MTSPILTQRTVLLLRACLLPPPVSTKAFPASTSTCAPISWSEQPPPALPSPQLPPNPPSMLTPRAACASEPGNLRGRPPKHSQPPTKAACPSELGQPPFVSPSRSPASADGIITELHARSARPKHRPVPSTRTRALPTQIKPSQHPGWTSSVAVAARRARRRAHAFSFRRPDATRACITHSGTCAPISFLVRLCYATTAASHTVLASTVHSPAPRHL